MNKSLVDLQCVPCRKGTPKLTEQECAHYLSQLTDWFIETETVKGAESNKLTKTYQFSNFLLALEFANRVGELAEKENHHPALLIEWGSVVVSWWTHSIAGLHQNDFLMAAKTDML